MTENEQVGKRLLAFRNILQLSQKAFAQRFSTGQGFISSVERGRKGIGHELLINIAKEIKNFNLRWLLTGEGEMFELEKLYVEPPAELPSGVEDALKIEYLKPEGELERIKRLLNEHEQRLGRLENPE